MIKNTVCTHVLGKTLTGRIINTPMTKPTSSKASNEQWGAHYSSELEVLEPLHFATQIALANAKELDLEEKVRLLEGRGRFKNLLPRGG